jgi:hypothetical protein
MALINTQHQETILTLVWNTLKNTHANGIPFLPRIDTTILLIRDWLQSHFSSHPKLSNALTTLKILDSTPSSAFFRRNDINPDDIVRLTWSLISSRPSAHQLFFETLLEINENTPPHIPISRLLQLAWILSPILTSTEVHNLDPVKPSLKENQPPLAPPVEPNITDPHASNKSTPPISKTTQLNPSTILPKQTNSKNVSAPKPLMSIHVDNNPQSQNKMSPKPVPLMALDTSTLRQPHIVQPKRLTTSSNRPRLYSDVCRQSPSQAVSPRTTNPQRLIQRRQQSVQQQPQPVQQQQPTEPPSVQPTTTTSSTNDTSSDLLPDFNTEMIELS